MRHYRLIIVLGLFICSTVFAGCDEEDGGWDPIQITVNGDKCKTSSYKVSSEGGEFRIYSKNYGSLWLNSVKENGDVVWPEDCDWSDYKNIHLTGEWYDAQYDESGNIVVNMQAKDKSASSRSITFEVECGDAFSSITLIQE